MIVLLIMIEILNKENCVGCNSCVQRCPVQCITMNVDEQGFLYPLVEKERCINCHLCEKVCPVINQQRKRLPNRTLAVMNKNRDIQLASSSGGIFYSLAKYVIERGGVVFGARFDLEWNVIHDYTDNLDGLKLFQGSKYSQSIIGQTFKQAETFLKAGRMVMFTGTPCQIAGLTLFLNKDYGNILLKVDVVCHGVPSPKVWQEYLSSIIKDIGINRKEIFDISFRDKREGWINYGFSLINSNRERLYYCPQRENIFMKGFLNDLYLRPSCFKCPSKSGKSQSDISIGDFWSISIINSKLYDLYGVSVVLDYNNRFVQIAQNLDFSITECNYEDVCLYSASITKSAIKTNQLAIFWNEFPHQGLECVPRIIENMNTSCIRRIKNNIITNIIKAIGLKNYTKIKDLLNH